MMNIFNLLKTITHGQQYIYNHPYELGQFSYINKHMIYKIDNKISFLSTLYTAECNESIFYCTESIYDVDIVITDMLLNYSHPYIDNVNINIQLYQYYHRNYYALNVYNDTGYLKFYEKNNEFKWSNILNMLHTLNITLNNQ